MLFSWYRLFFCLFANDWTQPNSFSTVTKIYVEWSPSHIFDIWMKWLLQPIFHFPTLNEMSWKTFHSNLSKNNPPPTPNTPHWTVNIHMTFNLLINKKFKSKIIIFISFYLQCSIMNMCYIWYHKTGDHNLVVEINMGA